MSQISKIFTGLVFHEDFNNSFSPKWDILPNNLDRVLFNEDSISLLPNDNELLEMLIPYPSDCKFHIKTKIEYIPKNINDIGGMVIKSTTGYTTECEFTYDESTPNEYEFINLNCGDKSVINLRASKDGYTWDDLGNTRFYDGNYIGYFIKGNEEPLKIHNFIMCTDKFVSIQGVSNSSLIEIIDVDGYDIIKKYELDCKVINGNAIIDIENMSWPLENVTLSVTQESGMPTTLTVNKLYGGDIFSFEPELLFSVDEINESSDGFNLGKIHGRTKTYTLRVFNSGLEQKIGKLVIEPVSTYDNGHHMAYIYPFESECDTKSKELEVAINTHQEFKCIIKIVKDTTYTTIDDDFGFKVVFE